MAAYSVALAASARKELYDLPRQELTRVHHRLVTLAATPRPHGCQKLAGAEDLYRIRQGDHRIVYQVTDATHAVLVLRIRHRKDAYR